MRTFLLALGFLALPLGASAALISPLQGQTTTPQWQFSSTQNEWFSRYSPQLDTATLLAFASASASSAGVDLYASSSTVKVSYLGTGATRDSNLFLAGAGSFNSSSFWAPIYASGGSNNLGSYNPVNASNMLFSTRAGCSFAQAKAGNTCLATQIGMSREISGLTVGEQLVFGLQALPLIYNGGGSSINLPNTHYFFSGSAANNSDSKGWADGKVHTRVLQIGEDDFLVGFEDMWLGAGSTSDKDYNDMVFLFQGVATTPVPEPETIALMLPGLGLLAVAARRRRR